MSGVALSNLILQVADLLRSDYRPAEYRKVILVFGVVAGLRRHQTRDAQVHPWRSRCRRGKRSLDGCYTVRAAGGTAPHGRRGCAGRRMSHGEAAARQSPTEKVRSVLRFPNT